MLKDMLHESSGILLNISGGMGQSETDPIVLMDQSMSGCSHTLALTLRCIGKSRGVLWKALAIDYIQTAKSSLYRAKLKVLFVTQEEVVTTLENYYFSIECPAHDSDTLSLPVISDPRLPIGMPYELGWLHFDSLSDLEVDALGSGQSLAYGAPGIKGTFFQFNPVATEANNRNSEHRLNSLFDKSVSDFFQFSPAALSHNANFNIRSLKLACFRSNYDISVIGLARIESCIFKVRISYFDDPILEDLVSQTLMALEDLLSNASSPSISIGR